MQMHVSIPSANGRVGNDKAMSSIHFGRRCDLSATAGRWNTAKQAIFASGAHYRQQIILKPAPLARAAAASTDGKTHICISSTAAACALPRHKILFQLSANPPGRTGVHS
jgi:hypothetical protein